MSVTARSDRRVSTAWTTLAAWRPWNRILAVRRSRPARWGATLVAFVAAATVLAIAADYGVAWDDAVQTEYGRRSLEYFRTLGRDKSCNEFLDLRLYGPGVEVLIVALARFAPHRLIEIRHLICGAMGLLVIPSLLRFGRLVGGRWMGRPMAGFVGVFGAAIVWTMPSFFGHVMVNTKDIPFAVGMTASLASLAEVFARGRYSWRDMLRCGVLIGMTTAMRPGGWMLIGAYYIALAIFTDFISHRLPHDRCATSRWLGRTRRIANDSPHYVASDASCDAIGSTASISDLAPNRPASQRRRSLLRQAALFATAWGVMILPWPWAHASPWDHPVQAIRAAGKFHLVIPVLFEGEVVPSDELPRAYLLKYVAYTTPPIILTLAAVGLVAATASLVRRPTRRRAIPLFVLLLWPTLPLLLFALTRPNAYDGMRHFLFIVPAIGLLAAVGAFWIAHRVEKWIGAIFGRVNIRTRTRLDDRDLLPTSKRPVTSPSARMCVVSAALLMILAPNLTSLIRLHPYQMTYINSLGGGMAQAERRFETDYWLTSYKDAIEWIHRDQQASADTTGKARRLAKRPDHPPRVLVAANEHSRWCADYFARGPMQIETTLVGGQPGDLPDGVDYYVATTRSRMADNFPDAEPVHVVGRAGATFAVVKRPRRPN